MANSYNLILGFPGVGKSQAAVALREEGYMVVDCDVIEFINMDDFPTSYLTYIQSLLDAGFVVFGSTHDKVRAALNTKKQKYLLAMPNRDSKTIYRRRYVARGNNDAYLKIVDDKYYDFLDELRADFLSSASSADLLELRGDQYLIDARQYFNLQLAPVTDSTTDASDTSDATS